MTYSRCDAVPPFLRRLFLGLSWAVLGRMCVLNSYECPSSLMSPILVFNTPSTIDAGDEMPAKALRLNRSIDQLSSQGRGERREHEERFGAICHNGRLSAKMLSATADNPTTAFAFNGRSNGLTVIASLRHCTMPAHKPLSASLFESCSNRGGSRASERCQSIDWLVL